MNANDELSACESILLDGHLSYIRAHVGIACLFWSHVQRESLLGDSSTLRSLALCCASEVFVWLDYMPIRQLRSGDFSPLRIIELIRDTGSMTAQQQRPAFPECKMTS